MRAGAVAEAGRAVARRAVLHLRRPGHVQRAVGADRGSGEAVDAEARVRDRHDVGQRRDRHRRAPGDAAVLGLDHPDAVVDRQALRAVPEHVDRAVGADDRTRALAIQHVRRDQRRRAEGLAAVARIDQCDRRLHVTAVGRVEDEARPAHVDAVAERAARVVIGDDPLLVVERRRRGGRIDEGRRAPGERAVGGERALVDGHGVGGGVAVEAEARVVDLAAAVEAQRRVSAGIVAAAGQPRDAGDQRAQVLRVAAERGPAHATVVRVVGARVAVAERAARRAADRACPCPRDVVVGRADHAQRVVRIDRDARLVLRRTGRVKVHHVVGRQNHAAVSRVGERRAIGGEHVGRVIVHLDLDEGGHADLQALGAVDRGDLALERRDVVGLVGCGGDRLAAIARPGAAAAAAAGDEGRCDGEKRHGVQRILHVISRGWVVTVHRAPVRPDRLASGGFPESSAAVGAAGSQEHSVRAKCHRQDSIRMHQRLSDRSAGRRIPQFDGPIAAGGGE